MNENSDERLPCLSSTSLLTVLILSLNCSAWLKTMLSVLTLNVSSEAECHLAFVEELLSGLVHLGAGELVDGEAIDDFPGATWGDTAWE